MHVVRIFICCCFPQSFWKLPKQQQKIVMKTKQAATELTPQGQFPRAKASDQNTNSLYSTGRGAQPSQLSEEPDPSCYIST